MNDTAPLLLVIGRILMGLLFVVGGMRHAFVLPALTEAVAGRRLPCPRLTLIAASVFQVFAGSLLMLGVAVIPAALALVVFTLLASVVMLNFWDKRGPERELLRALWLSNLAIVGGLLIAAVQDTGADIYMTADLARIEALAAALR
jgi:putative oxidoreductase